MTIPKSYEALAADLASEKILSKTLIGQKEACMMLADKGRLDLATWKQKACEAAERESALRESLTDKREEYNKLGDRYDAIQQRLTVAEQLLRDIIHSGEWNSSALEFTACDGFDLLEKIDAALKPAAEVTAYCTHPPGCKQCSWCGFKGDPKLAAEGEGS